MRVFLQIFEQHYIKPFKRTMYTRRGYHTQNILTIGRKEKKNSTGYMFTQQRFMNT